MPSKKLGLIGKHLGHSFSKKYFEEKFSRLGLYDYSYLLFELTTIQELKSILQEHILDGFNVTIPYKESILPFLDEIDTSAKEIGAVNTVLVSWDNKTPHLTGFNTDAFGFDQMIKPFLESHHEKALILGTGGASKAVHHVLKNKGIESLFVSRNNNVSNTIRSIGYGQVNEYVIKFHLLIINTTPVGMFPNTNDYPNIPYQYLTSQHTLIDLVYNPLETTFMQKGKEKGANVLNGLTMLHQQAEKAWEIWQNSILL